MMRRGTGSTETLNLSDEALVKRVQGGERGLLEELTERFLSPVYNRVVRMAPPSDVDDLTQEVMMAIVRSVDRFSARSSVSTWVHAIVNNKLKYYYRQRRHSRVRLQGAESQDAENDPPPIPDEGNNPLVRLMESDERGAVARVVNGLRPAYQQVLRLRFTDEREFKEIGEVMGLSLDAVKSLFRRAVADAAGKLRRLRQGQGARGALK